MTDDLMIPALTALVVGFVAGVVSLVVSILTKDQKTSEFRQNWIDALRSDVSQLTSHLAVVNTMSEVVRALTDSERRDYLVSLQKDFLEAAMLQSRIRLRLNPDEHQTLISLVSQTDGIGQSEQLMRERVESITVAAQEILKEEWERVKKGEPSFVWLKNISKIAFIFVLIALAAAGTAIAWAYGSSQSWWTIS